MKVFFFASLPLMFVACASFKTGPISDAGDDATDGGCPGPEITCRGTCGPLLDACGKPVDCDGCGLSLEGGPDGGGDGGGGPHAILYGGIPSGAIGNMWSYDGTQWSLLVASGPPQCWQTSMATLGNALVLFGGLEGSTLLGDTWIFEGGTWSRSNGNTPGARRGQCMASLGSSKVVMFGGMNGSVLADTWIFDGTEWAPGPTGPSGRYECAMAAFGNGVLMFGGQTSPYAGSELGDSWLFDGTTWTSMPGTGPSARSTMGMATRAGTVVMFGGGPTSGQSPSDTWVFNGSWNNPNITGPPGRFETQMTTFGNTVLLYGGITDTDMWSFDGSAWRDLGDNQPPGERASATMATLP